MQMNPKYCTVINGKEYPNWSLKSIEESSHWDLKMRACWYELCKLFVDYRKNPEDWVERIRNSKNSYGWKHSDDPDMYFHYYISDDFFYAKCNVKGLNLDEKAEAPLSDLTNRQIIEALLDNAFDKLYPQMSVRKLKEYLKNY